LFGIFGGKKKQDGDASSHNHTPSNQAQAPGAKSNVKNQLIPFATASPTLAGQYARYPLHVERAVYRLSHIKLANPRRPLYEQVLISNLMFWYLGVINKPATPTAPPNEPNKAPAGVDGSAVVAQPMANGTSQPVMSTPMSPAQQAALAQQAAAAAAAEKARLEAERLEKEQREKEEREREVQESQERERREREQREKERLEKEREREKVSKKTGLTKAERDRARKAETPVKGTNYGVQSPGVEQEYGWDQGSQDAGGGGRSGTSAAAPGSTPLPSPHTRYHLPGRIQQGSISSIGSGPQQPYFHQQDMSQVVYQPPNPYVLPPGAKPPATVENTWAISSSAAGVNDGKQRRSPPPSSQTYYEYNNGPTSPNSTERPRTAQNPPTHDYLGSGMPNGARPARSLSANSRDRPPALSGSTASGTFTSSAESASSSRPVEYERPAHNYSQSASAAIGQTNGVPPQPIASSSSGRLQKKKSTGNVTNAPTDGTKPPARRRKSVEAGGGDRRGVVEPDISFESLWLQQQFSMGG